jgi:hypothetical protein
MADVEMTDAAPAAKSSKAGAAEGTDKKPRFEVKKVRLLLSKPVSCLKLT